MDNIILLPLIKLYKVYGWDIVEEKNNYVVMKNENITKKNKFGFEENIVSIPKYVNDLQDFEETFYLKSNKLLKFSAPEDKEDIKFKLNELYDNIIK